ncbi:MAG: hypothetical protein AAFO91_19385 [Bacteroidota bacterium]
MPKRTQVEDYEKIMRADDIEKVVQDKRTRKRASKQKGTQRNRRYEKRLLRHLQQYGLEEE